MLPIACDRVSTAPVFHPDPADFANPANSADPPAGLHLLPSELLARIVHFLCLDAAQAFVQTGPHVHERVGPNVVIARLQRRTAQVATLSTMRAALHDATHASLSAGQRAHWLGALAGRLSAMPPNQALPAARALLKLIVRLPAERRGEPLIALMNGMSFADMLDPWDGFRGRVLAHIRGLPLERQAGPLARYLHLLGASELDSAAVREWIAHIDRFAAPERGLLLTRLAESSAACDTPWTGGCQADLLAAAAALPAGERAPLLCVMAVRLGNATGSAAGERAAQALRCWGEVLDAARALPAAGASEVLDCLAAHLSRAVGTRGDCWQALWAAGTELLTLPEHRASWLASMACHACAGGDWKNRWDSVWRSAAALPPRLAATVAHRLAQALRGVADDAARRPRWQTLFALALAPALPSPDRARLLKRLAAVLQTQATVHDDASWEGLIAAAETLAPLDEALVLAACMDDVASAEGLWGAHLRKYAALSPEQVATALVALAPKLRLLTAPERRSGACIDLLKAIRGLPTPLQLRPALALAQQITELAADGGSLTSAVDAMLRGWAVEDRLQWLLAATASIDDHGEATWLVARLSLIPAWMHAWPLAELADWAARHAELEEDVAGAVWIELCVAGAEVPAGHRGVMLPAFDDLCRTLPATFGARPDLERLRAGVPSCDLPPDADGIVSAAGEEERRGVKRGRPE